jgi:hypothetical protein
MAKAAIARTSLPRRRRAPAKRVRSRTRRAPWMKALRQGPPWLRIGLITLALLGVFLAVNSLYQVIRKPSELFFPVSGALNKTPAQTWSSYGNAFRDNATAVVRPELLAALAQMEAAGNPVARTYWRWSWTLRPFEIYKPASSSVGMYQMTDGTFTQAKQLCIRDHQVRHAGAWNDWNGCWFNDWYTRVRPGDAIEMTSAYLDVSVSEILVRHRIAHASLAQKDRLAAVVHLCGAGAADLYARRGFRFDAGQRCGDHDPRAYVAKVAQYEREFADLAARG